MEHFPMYDTLKKTNEAGESIFITRNTATKYDANNAIMCVTKINSLSEREEIINALLEPGAYLY